nr:efflux RND transporter permease subunit [Leptospira borgpetersenii]
MGIEFLPELDEDSINIRCFFPVGISLKTSEKYVPIIRSTILKHEQVSSVLTQLGRNDEGSDPYGPNRLEILVGLKDYSVWKEKISKRQLLSKIKKELQENLPGIGFLFSQPILDNVTESVTGSVSDLAILINGEDLNILRNLGEQILTTISEIPGATESGIEQEEDQTQLTIEINRKQAARYGINTSEILDTMEAAIASGIGSDIQKPLATVIVGGLTLELLVTLVYIPSLFYLTEKRKRIVPNSSNKNDFGILTFLFTFQKGQKSNLQNK